MTFAELIKKHKWEEIESRFLELYEDQSETLEGYEYVFTLLPTLEYEDVGNMRLCIFHADNKDLCDDEDPDEWEDVCGRNGEPLKNFDGELILDDDGKEREETWAIELSTWNYWASLPVDAETLSQYSEIDVICHALWEMTFFGFDQEDILAVKTDLNERCEEIKNGTAELIPWEEVKKKLEEEIGEEL